jgi:ABC-type polysaccharide/polyol phosphate export permease
VNVSDWPLLALVLVAGATLSASLGLLFGTLIGPRQMQIIFSAIVLPATMLGCVYFPWAALRAIRWLQILVLANPIVYVSEALRALLTPKLPHMPYWAFLLVLVGGTLLIGYLAVRTFARRVLS